MGWAAPDPPEGVEVGLLRHGPGRHLCAGARRVGAAVVARARRRRVSRSFRRKDGERLVQEEEQGVARSGGRTRSGSFRAERGVRGRS